MDSEYEILSHLEKNRDTSQRKIAGRTGLSLGTVNLLLKKMVRKGLVKIERLNAKTLRYIITPQGMAEKTSLVYQYMKTSYHRIVKISQVLEQIVAEHQARRGPVQQIIFCGPPDEILEILKIATGNLGLKYDIVHTTKELENFITHSQRLKEGSNVSNTPTNCDRANYLLVITWTAETVGELKFTETVNILNLM